MKKEYDVEYVRALEDKVEHLEQELHLWQFNGVYLDLDDKFAVWAHETDELLEKMSESERRELEHIDNTLAELGF